MSLMTAWRRSAEQVDNELWCEWLIDLTPRVKRWVMERELELFDAWQGKLTTRRLIEDTAREELGLPSLV